MSSNDQTTSLDAQPKLFSSSPGIVTPPKDRGGERERRVSARGSQHGGLTAAPANRLGSRSPNSIPSSPTSVHSSSSAIFERDIEPITCPSPPHPHHPHPYSHTTGPHTNSSNPHRRTPRSKANEQLDQSVPSVLDSAAAILTSCTQGALEDEKVSVVAPATARDVGFSGHNAPGGGLWSGVTSPIGSLRSRSPSPTALGTAGRRTSLLLSIPNPPLSLQTNVPPRASSAAQNLSVQTSSPGVETPQPKNSSTPSIVTPTSAYYSMVSSTETETDNNSSPGGLRDQGSSPTTTTLEHPPSSFPHHSIPLTISHPPSPLSSPLNLTLGTSPLSITTSPLAVPGAVPGASGSGSGSSDTKRLSFMSYTDLLASTPASLQPLSSFTTSASSAEPPPHIPSVSGITQASAQAQFQAQMQAYSPSHSPGRSGGTHLAGGAAGGTANANMNGSGVINVIEGRERGRSPGVGVGDRDSIGVFDDVGGEWEREGMGSGLEERLEALLNLDLNLPGVGMGMGGVPPVQVVQGRA